MKSSYATQVELKAWADSAFWGGHTVNKFSHNGVEALVVIGSQTGGIPSSETYVFCQTKDKQYKLILTRQSVSGILKAHEVDNGIEIRTEKGRSVLFVPWYGVAEDFDYFEGDKK